MSKESRRRQRAASQSGAAPTTATPGATPGGTSRPAAPEPHARAGRRERVRYQPKQSFLERYRTLLIGVGVLLGIALVGVFVFASAAQPAYACSALFDPAPTASPPVGASPQPGYVQPDMRNQHVAIGTKVTYANCPPASGKHFNQTGAGPITPRVYGPNDTLIPQNWVHNLEHGALVLLYKGDSEAATTAGQTALRAFFDSYPNSPVCNFPPGTNVGPVFVRFDDMKWPMAALVWNRVLPLQSLDTAAILEFDKTFGERANPEKLCSPSASPGASGSPSTSAEPSSSAPASAAPSAAPSASPVASPVASPSAS